MMGTDKAAPDWKGPTSPFAHACWDATRDHIATTDPDVVTPVISYSVWNFLLKDKVIAASVEFTRAELKVLLQT